MRRAIMERFRLNCTPMEVLTCRSKRGLARPGLVLCFVESEHTNMSEQIATRDWHTHAIVRIIVTTSKGSVDPWRTRTFNAGDELEMLQWGNAGRPVDRSRWWTDYDIDGAFILKADEVEVIRIIEEVTPIEGSKQA